MIQKSYENSNEGKLFLIPTPIGNMEDITYRAISILKSVDYIYAEDTRVTLNLLKKFNIKKTVKSCHKYSEEKHKVEIINLLKSGFSIGYVSDRGTPLISDPGEVIVKYAISNNITVISIPGPSALLPAINMSGLDNDKFLFYGFLNNKSSKRVSELKSISSIPFTIIFYEAPHRINETLKDMLNVLGNRNICICREISKMYEEIFRGNISQAIGYSESIKGEIVIVVEGYQGTDKNSIDYIDEVEKLVSSGIKISSAIKEVSELSNVPKNEIYREYMKYKNNN